jgi:hypothetical protein
VLLCPECAHSWSWWESSRRCLDDRGPAAQRRHGAGLSAATDVDRQDDVNAMWLKIGVGLGISP